MMFESFLKFAMGLTPLRHSLKQSSTSEAIEEAMTLGRIKISLDL